MADDAFDLPACPVFLVRDLPDGSGASIFKLPITDHGVTAGWAVVVFSTEALADEFRDGIAPHALGYVSIPTDNPLVLRRWFTGLAQNGATHVHVDPTARDPRSGRVGLIGPIVAAFQGG